MSKVVKLPKKLYEKELRKLHVELVKLQKWVIDKGIKVVVIFEGRDAAGKGGAIKRVTQTLNPRHCRVAALPVPTEKDSFLDFFPSCLFLLHTPESFSHPVLPKTTEILNHLPIVFCSATLVSSHLKSEVRDTIFLFQYT